MMAPFYYQAQNSVGGLECQSDFSNCLFTFKKEDKFEYGRHFDKAGLGGNITPSCKRPLEAKHSVLC